ncbi:MAG: 50S ribosomal protein L29 [Myxococcales bacterium FL481]|nr:MAG: 50S ribosomal protein L29 [Myxococcales bacterium FL481]
MPSGQPQTSTQDARRPQGACTVKPSEIRDKTDEELVELERELRDRLLRMRVAQSSSRTVDTSQFSRIRRDIARINTIRTERELGLTRA